MGSEDKKKPPFGKGFSFAQDLEPGMPHLREPSELIGETRFVPMDVYENDKELVIVLDLPGVSIEDISITLQDSWVVVEGVKKDTAEVKEKAEFLCSERAFGPFKRLFKLTMALDVDASSAVYGLGTLNIILPKLLDRRRRAHKIQIRQIEE